MISTGTGIAPFASLIRDPETYEKFDQVVLTHTCRDAAELGYGNALNELAGEDPLIGELTGGRLTYYATTTRENSPRMGRITTLIENGGLFRDLGAMPFDRETDRVMICGSMEMLKDVKALVEKAGFEEGSHSKPGDYVVERAFVG
jgi:ferredoxin--NADP+ reductase